jgi:uncharacterized membrane protein (UPF0182 family)
VLAVMLVAAAAMAWTAADYLWFRKLGFAGVFSVTYGVRWAMFGVAGGFMALVTGFSAGLARRLRPPLETGRASALERARLAVDQRWGWLLGAVLTVVGIVSGLAGAASWATWVQFANRTSFGRRDPQFHLDISFFVFVYPFLRLILGFLFAAVLVALVAAAAVHVLYGGLRFRPGDTQITAAARAQLFILAGFFVLLKGAAYWLDRYGTEFSSHDVISGGASYTDVNAVLPAKTVLAAIAVLCAALFFAAAARHDPLLPAVGFGLLVLSAILIGGVYPAAVEQFAVKPHELTRETTYLDRQLAGTSRAFGLTSVRISSYPVTPDRSRAGPLEPVLTSLQSGTPHTVVAVVPARLRARARVWPAKHSYLGSPLARVAKLAPFLTLDGNVYAVVVGGQLDWVVDGYTTTSRYPYSAHYDATAAAAGSAAPVGPGQGQVDYIRDSVKAVVQARSGRVTLYQWDTTDPILRTWMKAVPGLIRPRRDMPRVLRTHLRYPIDLFDLQRQVLASYHLRTATAFYHQQHAWTVVGGPPVSLNLVLPGNRVAESSRTATYSRANGSSLAAYLTVASDPSRPGYGTLRLLGVPRAAVLAGPRQVQARFRSNPVAIAALTRLRHAGSTVIPGPLVTLPAGNGFLYAEPVYVTRAGRTPVLGTVLVSYDGRVVSGRTAHAALTGLSHPGPG